MFEARMAWCVVLIVRMGVVWSSDAVVALYNAYPLNSGVCFELGQSWSQRYTQKIQVEYSQIVHLKMEADRPVYVTALDCDSNEILKTAILWLTSTTINMIGWGIGTDGGPRLDLPPTSTKLSIVNDAKGYGDCRWFVSETVHSSWLELGSFAEWSLETRPQVFTLQCGQGSTLLSLPVCQEPVLLVAIGDAALSNRPLSALALTRSDASCVEDVTTDDDTKLNDTSIIAAVLGVTSAILALFVLGLLAGAVIARIAYRRRMQSRFRQLPPGILRSDQTLGLSLIARPATADDASSSSPNHTSPDSTEDDHSSSPSSKPSDDDGRDPEDVVSFVDTVDPPSHEQIAMVDTVYKADSEEERKDNDRLLASTLL